MLRAPSPRFPLFGALSQTSLLALWAFMLSLFAVPVSATTLSRVEADRIAAEIDSLLLKGDYSTVEQKMLWLIGNDAPRNRTNELLGFHVFEELFKPSADRYLPGLEKWIAAEPKNGFAHLILSKALYRHAWAARGTRFAKDIPPAALQLYKERLGRALAASMESMKLIPNNILLADLRLALAREHSASREELRSIFNLANTILPGSLTIHHSYLTSLSPKWGGNEEELFDFARSSASTAGSQSALVGLVIFAQDNVFYLHGGKSVYLKDPLIWFERESAYRELIKRFPSSGWTLSSYASDSFLVGKKAQGIDALRKALQAEPDHPNVIQLKATYGHLLNGGPPLGGSKDVSREEVGDVLKEANTAYKRGDLSEAERLYREATVLHPTRGNSWHMLGAILVRQGRFQEAVPVLERSAQLEPNRAPYFTQLCYARMKSGELEKGIVECGKAIGIDAAEKAAYLNRAQAYKMLGKHREAEADLKVASSLP